MRHPISTPLPRRRRAGPGLPRSGPGEAAVRLQPRRVLHLRHRGPQEGLHQPRQHDLPGRHQHPRDQCRRRGRQPCGQRHLRQPGRRAEHLRAVELPVQRAAHDLFGQHRHAGAVQQRGPAAVLDVLQQPQRHELAQPGRQGQGRHRQHAGGSPGPHQELQQAELRLLSEYCESLPGLILFFWYTFHCQNSLLLSFTSDLFFMSIFPNR